MFRIKSLKNFSRNDQQDKAEMAAMFQCLVFRGAHEVAQIWLDASSQPPVPRATIAGAHLQNKATSQIMMDKIITQVLLIEWKLERVRAESKP